VEALSEREVANLSGLTRTIAAAILEGGLGFVQFFGDKNRMCPRTVWRKPIWSKFESGRLVEPVLLDRLRRSMVREIAIPDSVPPITLPPRAR
jgi:hypothetical protein